MLGYWLNYVLYIPTGQTGRACHACSVHGKKSQRLFRWRLSALSVELRALLEHVGKKDDRPRDVEHKGEAEEEGVGGKEDAVSGGSGGHCVVDHVALGGDAQRVEHNEGVVAEPLEGGRDGGRVALLLRHEVGGVVVVADDLGEPPGHVHGQVRVGRVARRLREQGPDAEDDDEPRRDLHHGREERRPHEPRGRVVDLHDGKQLDRGGPHVGELEHRAQVAEHACRGNHVQQGERPQTPRQQVVPDELHARLLLVRRDARPGRCAFRLDWCQLVGVHCAVCVNGRGNRPNRSLLQPLLLPPLWPSICPLVLVDPSSWRPQRPPRGANRNPTHPCTRAPHRPAPQSRSPPAPSPDTATLSAPHPLPRPSAHGPQPPLAPAYRARRRTPDGLARPPAPAGPAEPRPAGSA